MDKFHEMALNSSLFKGRSSWYFCYLKSEKIAHVLSVLAKSDTVDLKDVLQTAVKLPQTILYSVAGEIPSESVLAELFALISMLRLSATQEVLSKENMLVLVGECEAMVERVSSGGRPSPFVSSKDFEVPFLEGRDVREELYALSYTPASALELQVKDSGKGQKPLKDGEKDIIKQKDRTERILAVVKNNDGISIKDITSVIKDCSEKTIQRELVSLIEHGLVEKRGERRWSLYYSAV